MKHKQPRSGHPVVACSVEGCASRTTTARTLGPDDGVWLETGKPDGYFICSKHWRRVPRYLKRRRSLLLRVWRKRCPSGRYWDYPGASVERLKVLQAERLIRECWARCVSVASGDVCVGFGTSGQVLDPGLAEELRRLALI